MGPMNVSEVPSPEQQDKGERRRRRSRSKCSWVSLVPFAIFALIVTAGPLLFGAVDRPVQIGLAVLLAAGVALRPPAALGRKTRWLALGVLALLVIGQFLPLPGSPRWRGVLQGELGAELPATRHPEPMRALDALCAAVVVAVWFLWVQTLARDRAMRPVVVSILVLAGVAVALVCFGTKGVESGKIYGIRSTPGWVGWGPFPNRNHTACFLAMSGLGALSVALWAWAKDRRKTAAASVIAFVLAVGALLASKSRGGLVAFGAGLALLLLLIVIRQRDRRAWIALASVVVLTGAMIAVFGGEVLARFTSQEGGAVSNDLRRQIWSDARGMWSDAPLLGHGLETFPQLFPVYTARDFDGKVARHPESSWLLWLCELGALPVLVLGALLAVFVVRRFRGAWQAERRGFYLTAGALAGVGALLVHAVFDVPAHRWSTAGFALALLAVAFPARAEMAGRRSAALAPLAVAAFWALPFLSVLPWSPIRLARLEARESSSRSLVPQPQVPRAEWEAVLKHFPLDAAARHYAGIACLAGPSPDVQSAERHFAIARRLAGSSWQFPVMEARALGARFPQQALAAWQDAVMRSGRRGSEVLRGAVKETALFRGFGAAWGRFVQSRPVLALAYARALMEDLKAPAGQAQIYFDTWRKERWVAADASEDEIANFHAVARWFANPAMLGEWIETHKGRWQKDYKAWVRLLSEWGELRKAWEVYARVIRESDIGTPPRDSHRDTLESQYRASPENPHLALSLAQHYAAAKETEKSEQVILRHAQREDSPVWFLRKAGHILARREQYAEAIAMVRREK
jgi:O-antigen ligase